MVTIQVTLTKLLSTTESWLPSEKESCWQFELTVTGTHFVELLLPDAMVPKENWSSCSSRQNRYYCTTKSVGASAILIEYTTAVRQYPLGQSVPLCINFDDFNGEDAAAEQLLKHFFAGIGIKFDGTHLTPANEPLQSSIGAIAQDAHGAPLDQTFVVTLLQKYGNNISAVDSIVL